MKKLNILTYLVKYENNVVFISDIYEIPSNAVMGNVSNFTILFFRVKIQPVNSILFIINILLIRGINEICYMSQLPRALLILIRDTGNEYISISL